MLPVYPSSQEQLNASARSEQLPPCRHGLEAHSSISIKAIITHDLIILVFMYSLVCVIIVMRHNVGI